MHSFKNKYTHTGRKETKLGNKARINHCLNKNLDKQKCACFEIVHIFEPQI